MPPSDDDLRVALSTATARLRQAQAPFITLFSRGDVSVELFAPEDIDTQSPHQQDELYIVISGEGRFRRGVETTAFAPGDLLFVGAGIDHRFETFSPDFRTYVIFFGPKGGTAGGTEG